MIGFKLDELTISSAADLESGQFFIDPSQAAGCMAVAVHVDEEGVLFMPLAGLNAFRLKELPLKGKESRVLVWPLEPDRLRIRVDESSSALDPQPPHPLGRLLLMEGRNPVVRAEWHKPAKSDVPDAVDLTNWRFSSIARTQLGFDRWTMSFLDETGSWHDLIDVK